MGGREGGKGEGELRTYLDGDVRGQQQSMFLVPGHGLFIWRCLCRMVARWKEGWAREGREGGREGGEARKIAHAKSASAATFHRTQGFRPLLTARWITHARAGSSYAWRCVVCVGEERDWARAAKEEQKKEEKHQAFAP